jgi:hypothetical protein
MDDALIISLEDGGDDNHIVSLCELAEELCGFSMNGLGELDPWVFLPRADEEWGIPYLLQPDDVDMLYCSELDDVLYFFHDGLFLFSNGFVSCFNNFVLDPSNFDNSWFSDLFSR